MLTSTLTSRSFISKDDYNKRQTFKTSKNDDIPVTVWGFSMFQIEEEEAPTLNFLTLEQVLLLLWHQEFFKRSLHCSIYSDEWKHSRHSKASWSENVGEDLGLHFSVNFRTRWSSKKPHPSVCGAQLSVRKVPCGPILVDTIPQGQHPPNSGEAMLFLRTLYMKYANLFLMLLDNLIFCQIDSLEERKHSSNSLYVKNRLFNKDKIWATLLPRTSYAAPIVLLISGIYRWEWLGLGGNPGFSRTFFWWLRPRNKIQLPTKGKLGIDSENSGDDVNACCSWIFFERRTYLHVSFNARLVAVVRTWFDQGARACKKSCWPERSVFSCLEWVPK